MLRYLSVLMLILEITPIIIIFRQLVCSIGPWKSDFHSSQLEKCVLRWENQIQYGRLSLQVSGEAVQHTVYRLLGLFYCYMNSIVQFYMSTRCANCHPESC